MKKGLFRKFSPKLLAASPISRINMVWLIGVMLLPVTLAYVQTVLTGHATIRDEAKRVSEFLLAEAEDILSETERTIDGYLHETNGSCRSSDLSTLSEFVATGNAVKAMGVVAPDGQIACTVGRLDLDGLIFPKILERHDLKPKFAELRSKGRSFPVIVKRGRGDFRVFAVMSKRRFENVLLPDFIINYAQIDVVLPRGGLWYTLTGNSISSGFSEDTFVIEKPSHRFPIALNLVLDDAAGHQWGGGLRTSLVIIILICISLLFTIWTTSVFFSIYRQHLVKRARQKMAANANEIFEIRYQPMIDLKTKLLMGAIVKFDLSIYDEIPEYRPDSDAILARIWKDIGKFATDRRRFFLLIELEGDSFMDEDIRNKLIAKLKAINYEDIIIQINWGAGRGVDPNLYRALETISTAGCMLAVECGTIRFSYLADMWSWPYHRLIVDFDKLPRAEDSIVWTTEIVADMAEQLQVEAVATGLYDESALELAIGTGFTIGAGDEIGPALPIDIFLSVVRPVQGSRQAEAA